MHVCLCDEVDEISMQVLKLENMVTGEELQEDEEYEDILADVRAECSQYGQVQRVLIPRTKDGFPAYAEGHIFVLFADVDSAVRGAMKLYGRKFADRTVIVNYVSFLSLSLNHRNAD
jgi:splicing factor U2AF 65 kDa subunit